MKKLTTEEKILRKEKMTTALSGLSKADFRSEDCYRTHSIYQNTPTEYTFSRIPETTAVTMLRERVTAAQYYLAMGYEVLGEYDAELQGDKE